MHVRPAVPGLHPRPHSVRARCVHALISEPLRTRAVAGSGQRHPGRPPEGPGPPPTVPGRTRDSSSSAWAAAAFLLYLEITPPACGEPARPAGAGRRGVGASWEKGLQERQGHTPAARRPRGGPGVLWLVLSWEQGQNLWELQSLAKAWHLAGGHVGSSLSGTCAWVGGKGAEASQASPPQLSTPTSPSPPLPSRPLHPAPAWQGLPRKQSGFREPMGPYPIVLFLFVRIPIRFCCIHSHARRHRHRAREAQLGMGVHRAPCRAGW